MSEPEWFQEWKENHFKTLMDDVKGLRHDMVWLKWLTGIAIAAILAGAIAILIGG